jgi:hypothetical protein
LSAASVARQATGRLAASKWAAAVTAANNKRAEEQAAATRIVEGKHSVLGQPATAAITERAYEAAVENASEGGRSIDAPTTTKRAKKQAPIKRSAECMQGVQGQPTTAAKPARCQGIDLPLNEELNKMLESRIELLLAGRFRMIFVEQGKQFK